MTMRVLIRATMSAALATLLTACPGTSVDAGPDGGDGDGDGDVGDGDGDISDFGGIDEPCFPNGSCLADLICDDDEICRIPGGDGDGDGDFDGGVDPDDLDGDGIVNAEDLCPDEAEDVDGIGDDDGCPDQGDLEGAVVPPAPQLGVVYTAHYFDNSLRMLRIDRDPPAPQATVSLVGVTHDVALDPLRDFLITVHDAARQVDIYKLDRPTGPDDEINTPVVVRTLDFSEIGTPLFAEVDGVRERLFVVVSPEGAELPITSLDLYIYDLDVDAKATAWPDAPFLIPVSNDVAIDSSRDLLFLVDTSADTLNVYDLSFGRPLPLPGAPIALLEDYPEDNQNAFQVRNLTVDETGARVFAARAQGPLSELIAYAYPDGVPQAGARYRDYVRMSDFEQRDDYLEVALPTQSRPVLQSAYTPLVDPYLGNVFLVADAYNGTYNTATVVALDDTLQPGPGCGDHDDTGCWFRAYFNAEPSTHLRTDGAACYDATHQRVVGHGFFMGGEDQAAQQMVFDVDTPELTMAPALQDAGSFTGLGALPIGMVCH